jgi:streptomycin 6-kinase
VYAVVVPAVLARNAVGVWGDAGRAWLADLPAVLSGVLSDLALEPGAPFDLTYHWVMAVTRADGTQAVLKLGVPGAEHLAVEAAALRAWGGRGAVRLLGHDAGRGALLLERAEPGTRAAALVPHEDSTATGALIGVMRELHAAPPPAAGVPALGELAADFDAYLRTYPVDGPMPRRLVQTAARLFADLCASAPDTVLLHGDLHHDNVLCAGRQPWLAIDPHGYVGDPGYDVGAVLYNPDPTDPHPDVLPLVPARLDQLVEDSGLPRDRVVAWCLVKAVLSEVWSCEDGGRPDGKPLAVAVALEPLL